MTISFTKYHGSGNDFILIDDRTMQFTIDSAFIAKLCHRHFGIGADGLILLQPSELSHATMRIFNADGNEAAMCGNGLRCAAHFLSNLMNHLSKVTLSSLKIQHHCLVSEFCVTATLGAPKQVVSNRFISVEETSFSYSYIDTGVPHLVIFTDDVTQISYFAKKLRHHPRFSPAGTNVNFAQKLDSQSWKMRTYERGVEAETLACGTGAAAVSVAAWHLDPTLTHVNIHCLSEEILQFDLFSTCFSLQKSGNANRKKLDPQVLTEIQMTGSVCPVFQGKISMKPLTHYERLPLQS